MQKTIIRTTYFLLIIFNWTFVLKADPIDLSSWTEVALNLPDGQGAGNWVHSNGNITVTQTINADPSCFLNNLNQSNYTMEGSWQVITGDDDDMIGFVFGYQDSSHFYIMDWKQLSQNASGYGLALEGFSIKKISAPTFADLSHDEFWESTGTEYSTIIASYFDNTIGYEDFTLYDFNLQFAPGEFQITVSLEDSILWEVIVNDSTYTSGQFGFYNFSQANVLYSGFEQGCAFIPGDANSNGSTNGLDVIYLVSHFKGTGPAPPDTCDCQPHGPLLVASDVNGNCAVNGIDVVYLVNYFKGQIQEILHCPDCPPSE